MNSTNRYDLRLESKRCSTRADLRRLHAAGR